MWVFKNIFFHSSGQVQKKDKVSTTVQKRTLLHPFWEAAFQKLNPEGDCAADRYKVESAGCVHWGHRERRDFHLQPVQRGYCALSAALPLSTVTEAAVLTWAFWWLPHAYQTEVEEAPSS